MSIPRPPPSALRIVLPTLVALGCATGSGSPETASNGQFPTEQEVARIENAPLPESVFRSDLRQAHEWRIEANIPARIEPRRWVERSAWGELLGGVTDATEGQVVPTEAMHCVASEFARFAVEQGGRPDASVQRFIVGGCNASVAHVSFRSLQGKVRSSENDEQLFERLRAGTLSLAQSAVVPGQRSVLGIGFARRDDRAAVYLATGRPSVELEPVETRLGRGQTFELRGRILDPAGMITAAINRGRYAVAACDPVGESRPPAFHFACEPDPADESAWVSLSFTPPNRVLGRRALDALVWPRGGDHRVYRRFEYTSARPIADATLFTPAFLEELNGVRARAGLGPVTHDAAQSETATRVAPHFFAAMAGAVDERMADLAALGLLAGWDVDGKIRSGGIAFGAVPETNDLAVLLSATLEDPLARTTLLDPEADRLAVGPIVGRAGNVPVLAAVVTTYSLFDKTTKQADADALFARLTEERLRRELPPPYRLVDIWMDVTQSADEVGRGETPEFVLDDLLQASVTTLSREVSGWYGEAADLDEFGFPEALLTAPRLGTAIGISHRKDPDEAWGRYVLLIVSVLH